VPDKATSFKGRALMKFRIESQRPEKYDKPEVQPFKRRIKPVKVCFDVFSFLILSYLFGAVK